MDNPVPYYPGESANEAIAEMVKTMMSPDCEFRLCVFCGTHDSPGLVGVAMFEGEQAALMGARPGKGRSAVYYVCLGCASKYESQASLDEACDAELLRHITILNGETPH